MPFSTHRDFLVGSLDYLIERIWDELKLVKIYTKKRGAQPDLSDPICLRTGATIEVRSHPFLKCFVNNREYGFP